MTVEGGAAAAAEAAHGRLAAMALEDDVAEADLDGRKHGLQHDDCRGILFRKPRLRSAIQSSVDALGDRRSRRRSIRQFNLLFG